MSKEQIQHKILWLASYPKSGNTWFRAFLTALLNEGEVDINDMDTDGIFSARGIFDHITDVDSRYLYDEEAKDLLPEVFRTIAKERAALQITKVHDAFSDTREGQTLIPEDVTHCALYFIRNPLDIVASLANHNNTSIDVAVELMNNKKGQLAKQRDNLNISVQFPQLMYDWSGHVLSWTERPRFPVYAVRYEDMLEKPLETFRRAVTNVGWNYSDEDILKAIEACSFEKLKQKETEKGFWEKNIKSPVFFRQGKSGNWVNELTEEQASKIIEAHKGVMEQYGYFS